MNPAVERRGGLPSKAPDIDGLLFPTALGYDEP